jgi:hypothetical protein
MSTSIMEDCMVKLDQELISGARACVTDGASSRNADELIDAYELAVRMYNQKGVSHVNYMDKEHALRVFVTKQRRSLTETQDSELAMAGALFSHRVAS